MVKSLNTTRSDLIRKAVIHYRTVLEKERLKEQIRRASIKTREESLSISREFDSTLCNFPPLYLKIVGVTTSHTKTK